MTHLPLYYNFDIITVHINNEDCNKLKDNCSALTAAEIIFKDAYTKA